MKSKNIAPIIQTKIEISEKNYQKNKKMMLEKLDFLESLLDVVELGGGWRRTPSQKIG